MFQIKTSLVFVAALLLVWIGPTFESGGQNPSPTPARPPAPVLVSPANGAALAQPITLDWNPVSAPGGPIGSYTWQVGTSSTFTTVIASGFTNMDSDPSIPTRTADGVRSLPSATRTVQITNAAPIPAGVSPVAPASGATVRLPFFVDWSDTPNPQVPGYDLEFNTSPNFPLAGMVLLVSPSRSDYMITRDLLAPGNYFWRVRALHGDVAGLWSAGRAITMTAPIAPPNVNLFAILAEPVNAYGGNTAHARVMLDNPAPAGGAVVSISTDIPQVNIPATTVTVPSGRTDATISNIATGPVPNNGGGSVGIIGDLFAGFANGREQNSFGILPILYG